MKHIDEWNNLVGRYPLDITNAIVEHVVRNSKPVSYSRDTAAIAGTLGPSGADKPHIGSARSQQL